MKLFLFFLFLLKISLGHSHFITYEAPSGRFGDQLMAYMHAKWLSYRHGIPLLYTPFAFSKDLLLDTQELLYAEKQYPWPRVFIDDAQTIEQYRGQDQVLFYVRYFPESSYDLKIAHW